MFGITLLKYIFKHYIYFCNININHIPVERQFPFMEKDFKHWN